LIGSLPTSDFIAPAIGVVTGILVGVLAGKRLKPAISVLCGLLAGCVAWLLTFGVILSRIMH